MTGFLKLLNIQSRWEGEFPQSRDQSRVGIRIFKSLKDAFKGAIREANLQFKLDNQVLRERLHEIVADSQLDFGKLPGAITTRAYAEWIRDDDVEREHLLARLQHYFQISPNTTHQQASQAAQTEARRAIGEQSAF